MFSFKKDRTLIHIIWTTYLTTLVFLDLISAASQCCDSGTEINSTDTEWILVMNYANFGTPKYGDNTTTHCQCRQACLNLPGCTSYDWFPYGNGTHCWIGSNCPVNLTYDVNNQHYIPKSKLNCYSAISDKEVSWTLVKNYANFGTPKFGDKFTTHCQCRQACLDLPGCTGYDWFPYGNDTHCWIGDNCPVTLTYDVNNEHYIPNNKRSCYPPNLFGSAGSLLNSSNTIQILLSVALLLITKEILQIRIV